MYESYTDVIDAILVGDLDNQLAVLTTTISNRRDILAKQRFNALKVGDEVTFSNSVGKGLAGQKGTVTGKLQKNVQVRDQSGKTWRASPAILELV